MNDPTEPTCWNCRWWTRQYEEDAGGSIVCWLWCGNPNSDLWEEPTEKTDTCDHHEPAETEEA